jgi:hypothetical protein
MSDLPQAASKTRKRKTEQKEDQHSSVPVTAAVSVTKPEEVGNLKGAQKVTDLEFEALMSRFRIPPSSKIGMFRAYICNRI